MSLQVTQFFGSDFFNRGSRAEIGTFPGKELDNELSTCVVDVCPVGALTSTRFRFAERVFNLDKKASICNGCDAGCNVTIEHRRGKIRRLKPRLNPAVNDYWMCDFGRATWERWRDTPRLATPTVSGRPSGWKEALDTAYQILRGRMGDGAVAVLGSGFLSNEEAYLFAQLADLAGASHRGVAVDSSPERKIPNPHGGVVGREAAPNRRGAEMAGLGAKSKEDLAKLLDGAHDLSALVIADSDFGAAAWDPEAVAKLRKARGLVIFGWADSPLARAADVAIPIAAHPERDGTFVNSQNRLQRADAAFPPPAQVRSAVDALSDLLARFDPSWGGSSPSAQSVFEKMATAIPRLAPGTWKSLAGAGAPLEGSDDRPHRVSEEPSR